MRAIIIPCGKCGKECTETHMTTLKPQKIIVVCQRPECNHTTIYDRRETGERS